MKNTAKSAIYILFTALSIGLSVMSIASRIKNYLKKD